jgi:16S rRNA C1402 (ribose-2'-O) methylase RsmI
MKKFVVMALTGLALTAPAFVSAAQAEDAAVATEVTTETTATETTTVETVEKKLQDGTVVHVKGEEVFVVAADGTETAAPDGVHTLEDGTTIETKDGKVVTHAEAHDDAHGEEAAH